MTRWCNCPKSAASTLESDSQNIQPVKESCKFCGGIFLVYGTGPVSTSMLSGVGLEVSDSISPELSWKMVTKGRRSRKPLARNVDGIAKLGSRSPKRVGDFSVSDSDKFDESVTGCRVPNRSEHLPLKKRRALLQSPSAAPQSSSLHTEESLSPQLHTPFSDGDSKLSSKVVDGSAAVTFKGSVDSGDDNSIPKVLDRKLYDPDDFSGIALLAVAACIDGMDGESDDLKKELLMGELPVPERAGACSLSEPIRSSTSVGPGGCVRDDVVMEDDNAEYSSADNAVALPQSVQPNDENETMKAVSKVDRLHWDLNVVMDAWEQPFDDSAEGAPVSDDVDQNSRVGKLVLEGCGTATSTKSADTYNTERLRLLDQTGQIKSELVSGYDSACRRMTVFDEHSTTYVSELIPGAPSKDASDQNMKVEQLGGEGCGTRTGASTRSVDITHTENLKLLTEQQIKSELVSSHDTACRRKEIFNEHPAKPMNDLTPDAGNGNQEVRISPSLGFPVMELHQSVDKDLVHMASDNISVVQETRKGFKDSTSSAKGRVGMMENIVPDASESSAHENNINTLVGVLDGKSPELTDDSGSNSYEEHPSHILSKCKDSHVLGASTQSVVCNSKGLPNVSIADTESLLQVVPRELASVNDSNKGEEISACLSVLSKKDDETPSDDPTSCSAKIGSSLDDFHNSDVSLDERSNTAGSKDATIEFQDGYDSPYEDGELRVSMPCPWEEIEMENGENECVDYESDGREGMDSDGADYPGSEVVEAGSEGSQGTEKRSLSVREASVSQINKGGSTKSSSRICYVKDDLEKVETTGGVKSSAGSGTSMEQLEHNDDNLRRCSPDRLNSIETKGSQMEEINSRTNKGKLQSRVEGSASQDLMGRPDTSYLQQSRSRVYSRPIRDVSPEKFMGKQRSAFREGNGGDEQWGGYWDSRNCFPTNYHGLDGQGYSRHRKLIADSADKFGGLNSQDHGQSTNYTLKGLHRMQGRRLPYDRDDYYPHRLPGRPNRSRGSSGNHPQGVGRSIRDEYREPIHENRALSAGRMPHYLSRRDRDFSPPFGRAPQSSVPRRKSHSRSRSPYAWHPQRERCHGARRHSRSPDFRSEARVERVRMPFQKNSYPGDYPGSVMSPPRGRFSPHRNCRWVDDQDYVDNCLSHRRSPERRFRRGQRFDSLGSSGRLKVDDFYKPGIRPRRFSPISGAGKGCKYDDNYDDRRRNDRVDVIRRTRLSDAGVTDGRFRCDAEDNFDANDTHNDDDVRSSDLGRLADRNGHLGTARSVRGPVRLSEQYRY